MSHSTHAPSATSATTEATAPATGAISTALIAGTHSLKAVFTPADAAAYGPSTSGPLSYPVAAAPVHNCLSGICVVVESLISERTPNKIATAISDAM